MIFPLCLNLASSRFLLVNTQPDCEVSRYGNCAKCVNIFWEIQMQLSFLFRSCKSWKELFFKSINCAIESDPEGGCECNFIGACHHKSFSIILTTVPHYPITLPSPLSSLSSQIIVNNRANSDNSPTLPNNLPFSSILCSCIDWHKGECRRWLSENGGHRVGGWRGMVYDSTWGHWQGQRPSLIQESNCHWHQCWHHSNGRLSWYQK